MGIIALKKAKEMDIKQAVIFTARSGYLQNDNISINILEIPSNKNPVCLELVDTAYKLQVFLTDNKTLLADTNVILLNKKSFQLAQSI